MKKQSGITLVALVITIIVLLILAAVSLSLTLGQNGILSQASSAVDANRDGKAKEELAMAWSSTLSKYWADWANDATVNKSTYFTKANLDQYLSNGTIVGNPVMVRDGVYRVRYESDGKLFTTEIDTNGNVNLISTTNPLRGITADMVAAEPETYYGQTVNYSAKGINDWEIFYADADNIFLITSDFLLSTKVPFYETKMVTSGTTGKYMSFWATNPPSAQQVTDSVKTSFMWDYWTDYTTHYNARCISTLLRTENWRSFLDTTYADYAIGGPTAEMYCASWNSLYPADKLYCNNKNQYGHYFGNTDTPTTSSVSAAVMQTKAGYSNPLYYPHPCEGAYEGTYHWRLASVANCDNYFIEVVANDGYVGATTFDNPRGTLRPLVRLKANTTIEPGTDGYAYNLINN